MGPAGAASHEDAEARAQPSPAYVSVPPDVWALARSIAAVLGETMPSPIRIITRAVDRLGPDRVHALLGQAVAVALVSEKVPDLPKGLPEPAAGTRYTVFVARKQWGKIAEEMVDLRV